MAEFSDTAEHYYVVTLYNETIDLIVACLADHLINLDIGHIQPWNRSC